MKTEVTKARIESSMKAARGIVDNVSVNTSVRAIEALEKALGNEGFDVHCVNFERAIVAACRDIGSSYPEEVKPLPEKKPVTKDVVIIFEEDGSIGEVLPPEGVSVQCFERYQLEPVKSE